MADDGPKAAWDMASPKRCESFLSSPEFVHGGGTTKSGHASKSAKTAVEVEPSLPPTPRSQPETPRSPRSPRSPRPRVLSRDSHKAGGGILTVRERGFRRRVKKAVDQRAEQKTAVFRGVLKVRAPPPHPPNLPARAPDWDWAWPILSRGPMCIKGVTPKVQEGVRPNQS